MAWERSRHTQPPDWKRRRLIVLNTHRRICHVCQHGQADEVDHVIPQYQGGSDDLANLRPIHGAACPTCSDRCHVTKTAREAAAAKPQRRRTSESHPGLLW